LDLDYVVEGSVRRAPDRVRVSARLVETSGQTDVWAQSYDVELRDILSLQSTVAQAIVRQINLTVSPIATPPAVDPEAFEAYVKGLHEFNNSPRAACTGGRSLLVSGARSGCARVRAGLHVDNRALGIGPS
jgi:hypothetical protein